MLSSIAAPILSCASILSGIRSIGESRPHFVPGSETCPPKLIPRDVIFGNADVQNLEISPDGKYLAMIKPFNGVLNIWIQDLIPSNETELGPYPVTFDTGRGIRKYKWTFYAGTLLYRQDADGDENYRITKLNIISNETQLLTAATKARASISAVSEKYPDTVLLSSNARSKAYFDVYRLNLTSGEKTLILENNKFSLVNLSYVVKGKRKTACTEVFLKAVKSCKINTDTISRGLTMNDHELSIEFAEEVAPDGGTIFYRAVKDEQGNVTDWTWYRAIEFAEDFHTKIIGFHQNAPGKVIWSDATGRNLPQLVLKDIDKPEEKGEILYESRRATFFDGIFWPKFSDRPIFIAENYMRREYTLLNKTFQAQFDFLNDEAQKQDADWFVSAYSEDFTTWIIAFVYSDASFAYFQFNAPEIKFKYLFPNRAALSNYTLSRTYSVEVPVEDNFMQVCYLTIPRQMDASNDGIPSEPAPMVLKVHGGPWSRSTWTFDARAQFMANRGYIVLDCNYRGSDGYGKDYFKAGIAQWSKKMHNDLVAAVDWAIEKKIAIPDKVAIYGGSYGGYASLVGVTFTPDKFACAVEVVGVVNLITLLQSIPTYWEPFRTQLHKFIGGDERTEEGRRFLRSISPLNKVDQITKPLLVAQGTNDVRVKRNESLQIVDAMNERNIPVTYIEFTNEGHGFKRPENKIAFYAVQEMFLADCLGGRFELLNEQQMNASSAVVREYGQLGRLKQFHTPIDELIV